MECAAMDINFIACLRLGLDEFWYHRDLNKRIEPVRI